MVLTQHTIEKTDGERAKDALRQEGFVQTVQRRSGIATPGAATLAIWATLATLGERVRAEANALENAEESKPVSGLIPGLASVLPRRLGEALLESSDGSADKEVGEEFSLTEFFERVGATTGVGLAEAERHACAVAQTLEEAVGDGGLNGILSRLPDEYELLFV